MRAWTSSPVRMTGDLEMIWRVACTCAVSVAPERAASRCGSSGRRRIYDVRFWYQYDELGIVNGDGELERADASIGSRMMLRGWGVES